MSSARRFVDRLSAASAGLAAFAIVAFSPETASARVQRDLDYRYDQVWGTLVRMLHVDYRYPVDEQDEPHGYVLFRYVEYGRQHTASVELVRVADEDARVRLVVQVEGVPMHLEAQILDDLERKLRSEFGRPTRPAVVAGREPPPVVPRLADRPEDANRPRGDRNPPSDDSQPTEPATEEAPAAPTPPTGRRRRG